MKYKIIKAFLAVSFSVCLVYSSVRAAWHSSPLYNAIDNTNYTVETDLEIAEQESEDDFTFESRKNGRHEHFSAEPDDAGDDTTITPEDPDDTGDDTTIAPDEPDDTEDNSEITGSDSSAPTLDEYLARLTCGGCGRNCLLINPRCHNGMRKAETATENYYAAYNS